MSGAPWTPERKAAHSLRMRARWSAGEFSTRAAPAIDDRERAARSARMSRLNLRMRDDDVLKAKCVRGQKRVRRSQFYRAIQSAVMTDIMSRPELRRMARFHCITINKKPKVRKRQWATRRRKAGA